MFHVTNDRLWSTEDLVNSSLRQQCIVDHKLDGMSHTANAVDICIPHGFDDVTSIVSDNDVDLILQAPVLQYAKELCC